MAARDAEAALVWVCDHLIGLGPTDPLEAWTEMTAIAAVTTARK